MIEQIQISTLIEFDKLPKYCFYWMCYVWLLIKDWNFYLHAIFLNLNFEKKIFLPQFVQAHIHILITRINSYETSNSISLNLKNHWTNNNNEQRRWDYVRRYKILEDKFKVTYWPRHLNWIEDFQKVSPYLDK